MSKQQHKYNDRSLRLQEKLLAIAAILKPRNGQRILIQEMLRMKITSQLLLRAGLIKRIPQGRTGYYLIDVQPDCLERIKQASVIPWQREMDNYFRLRKTS